MASASDRRGEGGVGAAPAHVDDRRFSRRPLLPPTGPLRGLPGGIRSELQQAHRALAEATSADTDPDRRAWHRAQASAGPDDGAAAELVRSAARAQSRGGVVAAAAFLERAAELSQDPAGRVERTLAAARAALVAGRPDRAAPLVRAGPAACWIWCWPRCGRHRCPRRVRRTFWMR
ncbi:hypothetical protein [Micromonospora radicis]|uniref:hypothetical protein n=1 Tax=Micromonospora radicis TaxID=1894971 RepID=UPI0018F5E90B|nr:hypothetical protein [Micromonospora radicis]